MKRLQIQPHRIKISPHWNAVIQENQENNTFFLNIPVFFSAMFSAAFGALSLLLSERHSLVHLWKQRPVREVTIHSKTDS